MASVKFVDTSVLVEILDVPGKSQRRGEVLEQLRDFTARNVVLVLPITTVIETGNHIAQLPEGGGDARRACAQRYVDLLRATAEERLPWVLHAVAWDERMLTTLCEGVSIPGAAETTGPFVDLAGAGILGAGDLAILAECELYGEWLWLTHGVRYDHLPDWLIGLDLWRPSVGFLVLEDRDRLLGEAGVAWPPQLSSEVLRGPRRIEDLLGGSAFGDAAAEGVVVRRVTPAPDEPRLAKALSPAFERRSDAAWRAPVRNALAA